MKNKKLKQLIQKPLRFHHQDIHEELESLKKQHQVKSKWYYYFWGTCTVAVVLGQLYVGTGYRIMAESFNSLIYAAIEEIKKPTDGSI